MSGSNNKSAKELKEIFEEQARRDKAEGDTHQWRAPPAQQRLIHQQQGSTPSTQINRNCFAHKMKKAPPENAVQSVAQNQQSEFSSPKP